LGSAVAHSAMVPRPPASTPVGAELVVGVGENLSGNRSIAELVCDGHAVIRPTS